jgi:hypothetical protein
MGTLFLISPPLKKEDLSTKNIDNNVLFKKKKMTKNNSLYIYRSKKTIWFKLITISCSFYNLTARTVGGWGVYMT